MLKRKWVRLLLCLFMLPLSLVFSMPGAASAASSDTVSLRLSADWIDNLTGFGDADCKLPMAIGGTPQAGTITVGGAYCKAGPDFSPLYCVGFEHQCSTYAWEVKGDSGVSCDQGQLPDHAGSQDSMTTIHTAFTESTLQLGTCDPVEVCLTATVTGNDTVTACAATDLDLNQDPDNGCSLTNGVNMQRPIIEAYATVMPASGSWRVRSTIKFNIPPPSTGSASWRMYVIGSGLQGTTTVVAETGTFEIWSASAVAPSGTPPQMYTLQSDSGLMSEEAAIAYAATVDLMGIGIYGVMPGDNAANLAFVPRSNGSTQLGMYGISRVDRCGYYWGAKIAEYSAPSPYDEPLGGVDPPPPTLPPVDPEPDPEDPPVDDSSWWGWLGELLKLVIGAVNKVFGAVLDVVQAIAGLAGDIVDALLDGFEDLFVPDPEVLKGEVEDVMVMWDDTAPGQYLQAIEDITPGSGSAGCDGLQLNVTLPGNVALNESIGGACDGQMATVAGVVRGALSLTLIVGGIMACIRAVGSGLGWNPAVGRVDG